MKSAYRFFLTFLVLLNVRPEPIFAQTLDANTPFINNVVKIRDDPAEQRYARYGFITGINSQRNVGYFIQIFDETTGLKPNDAIQVIFNEDNYVRSLGSAPVWQAHRVAIRGTLRIDHYRIAVYQVQLSRQVMDRYFSPLQKEQVQHFFYDYFDMADPRENSFGLVKSNIKNDLVKQAGPLFLLQPADRRFVRMGAPLVTGNNTLVGIIADAPMPNGKTVGFGVLDIEDIRQALYRLAKENNEYLCEFFNLLEQGQLITPCEAQRRADSLARATDSLQQIAAADARKLAAITANQSSYVPFRPIRTITSPNQKNTLDDRQSAERRSDDDYLFSMSANAGVALSLFKLQDSKYDKYYWGSAYGINLHFFPDKGEYRFTLKPRYYSTKVGPGKDYIYTHNPAFKWVDAEIKSFEIPLILEHVNHDNDDFNTYLGIGYAYGRQLQTSFSYLLTSYSGTAVPVQGQSIIGNPVHYNKLWLETGLEISAFRICLYGNYRYDEPFNHEYTIIAGGLPVSPFFNEKRHFWTIGIDLSLRLWGQWKNGYDILIR